LFLLCDFSKRERIAALIRKLAAEQNPGTAFRFPDIPFSTPGSYGSGPGSVSGSGSDYGDDDDYRSDDDDQVDRPVDEDDDGEAESDEDDDRSAGYSNSDDDFDRDAIYGKQGASSSHPSTRFVDSTAFIPMLRTRHVYPGSVLFPSQISGTRSYNYKKRRGKTINCLSFFCKYKFHEMDNCFNFEHLQKKS
jgi:hypothetical protein